MGIFDNQGLIADHQEHLAAGLLNETLLSYVTEHFGIHGIAMDAVSCCWTGLVRYESGEMAANQLLTPVEEFLLSHDDNVMFIVFDSWEKWEKKLATWLRERKRCEAEKMSEDEIKQQLQQLNSAERVGKRKGLQEQTAKILRKKLGKLASRVTILTAEASGHANVFIWGDSDVIALKDDFAIILVHKTTGGVPALRDPACLR